MSALSKLGETAMISLNENKVLRLRSRLFYGYLLLLAMYAGIMLLPAPAPATLAQYHLSVLGLRIIDLTIILLLAAIWFAGLYGYTMLLAYMKLVRKTKDGKQIVTLVRGMLLLIIWLPVSSVTSAILNYFAMRHPGIAASTAIINNYVNLLFPFAGFILIGMAARGLSLKVRQRPSYAVTNFLTALNIYTGIIYYRLVATTANRGAIYHMSIWLILTTLVAPYVYMWSVGLRAAYELYIYQKKVAGVIYKKSWRYLTFGITWLIIASVVFQYVNTLTARLGHLSIYWLLVVVYSLLLLLSVGFIFIAIGARKLRKIEEV